MTLDEFRDAHNGTIEDLSDFAQLVIDGLTDIHLNPESNALYEAARTFITAKEKLEQVMVEVDIDLP